MIDGFQKDPFEGIEGTASVGVEVYEAAEGGNSEVEHVKELGAFPSDGTGIPAMSNFWRSPSQLIPRS